MNKLIATNLFFLFLIFNVNCIAQNNMKPEDTEVWSPVPAKVTPGDSYSPPPSDAIVLFGGNNLDAWESVQGVNHEKWRVHDGVFTETIKAGDIQTKEKFLDYQLHLEWMVTKDIQGEGQSRGNSGLYLSFPGNGVDGYELQILDSYNSKTYVNGMAGSIYKQYAPLVNASKAPGEWQSYDVIWKAPRFYENGTLKDSARVTVLFNNVLIQDNVALKGQTFYIGKPFYKAHGAAPIKLQAHGNTTKDPISFRNVWLRKL